MVVKDKCIIGTSPNLVRYLCRNIVAVTRKIDLKLFFNAMKLKTKKPSFYNVTEQLCKILYTQNID